MFLPIIAVHLLVFSSLTIWMNNRKTGQAQDGQGGTVDWRYLGRLLAILIVPKLIGVFGLITLPGDIMGHHFRDCGDLFGVLHPDRPFRSGSKTVDVLFLMLGGYISGTS